MKGEHYCRSKLCYASRQHVHSWQGKASLDLPLQPVHVANVANNVELSALQLYKVFFLRHCRVLGVHAGEAICQHAVGCISVCRVRWRMVAGSFRRRAMAWRESANSSTQCILQYGLQHGNWVLADFHWQLDGQLLKSLDGVGCFLEWRSTS